MHDVDFLTALMGWSKSASLWCVCLYC